MNFSELIKTKRKEKEITQEKLAEMIGTSKQTIANWENDRNKPQLNDEELINSIINVLKISKGELIESITKFSTEEENKNIIKYNFLPNELMNIKLSENEIEILHYIEYHTLYIRKYNNFNKYFHIEEYYDDHDLFFEDYIRTFGSIKNILPTKSKITKILNLIDIKTLLKIIKENNLKTFNIQELSKEDVYDFLKEYKGAFEYLINNKEELCFLKDQKICKEKLENVKLVPRNKLEKDLYDNDTFYVNSQDVLNQPYIETIFNDYFVPVKYISEADMIEYNKKLENYKIDLESWNKKMVEIKKLQDLYGAEKYPDISKPQDPELPEKKLAYKLNYKGILLKKFFEEMESKESDFVNNPRKLKSYLDKEISLFGTFVLEENNGYLFKSLYINGETIDHLWIYDIKEDLIIGNTYEIEGIVNIYTKQVDEKYKKNYGIKVSKIKDI